jgi:hypothetical protein
LAFALVSRRVTLKIYLPCKYKVFNQNKNNLSVEIKEIYSWENCKAPSPKKENDLSRKENSLHTPVWSL